MIAFVKRLDCFIWTDIFYIATISVTLIYHARLQLISFCLYIGTFSQRYYINKIMSLFIHLVLTNYYVVF